ncbi:MAG TPA: hypothetical protein VNY05_28440 [Candidatus Acidoferrales bacterium]|nr:hypothetical protein [Candidatus Acidoferrales bacterium]
MTFGAIWGHLGNGSILWTARFAFLFYAGALAAWLTGRAGAARSAWTLGLLIYLSHVTAAFQFHHHWSHAAAYEETARRTAELLSVRSGAGLYFNYAFTAVWTFDVIWLWTSAETYRAQPHWIAVAIHSFMAFLFFNATVVFVSGWVRWLGLTAALALCLLAWHSRAHLTSGDSRKRPEM